MSIRGATLAVLLSVAAVGAGAAEEKKDPAIEPEAVAAVERMGDFLKTLTAYSVHAETTTDEVLVAGPKVQYGGTIEATVRMPDRLRLSSVREDKDEQQFFYDGSTLTVWLKEQASWASAPVPPTVAEMIALVRGKYALALPLDDLIRDAVRKELLKDVKAGIVVGPGRVAGVDCDHLGFHEDDVDWQLWVEKGERPLPRKLVITTLGEPSQPQHTEVLTWDLSPKVDDAEFRFTPPEGAQHIVLAEPAATVVKTPAASKQEKH
ncbi:MAG: DUF2092 domain-containing protein [Vicinamibacteria bacterium]